jgi:hypothetical protein
MAMAVAVAVARIFKWLTSFELADLFYTDESKL